ncbi:MAG: hypothetical protein KKE29_12840 [Proteobacteria bacterium]|nr:hypothetical protein [Pseudomonadota bacterium]MBU4599080.1 hypothetical protein [Pseudomonadota bacterium]MBV1714867.1 hypothetical protein [Desulfarculus sp.]
MKRTITTEVKFERVFRRAIACGLPQDLETPFLRIGRALIKASFNEHVTHRLEALENLENGDGRRFGILVAVMVQNEILEPLNSMEEQPTLTIVK